MRSIVDKPRKDLDFATPGLPCTAPVTIHIGYPRTASTFLTKAVYYRHPDIECSHWLWQLADLEQGSGLPDGKASVLLDVRLSGWVDKDRIDLAPPLKQAVPNGKILCFIRDQRSMARAQYFLYLKSGGLRSLDSFVRTRQDSLLHYDRLYDAYSREFGKGKVLFIPYESLLRERDKTVGQILDWIGVTSERLGALEDERVKPSSGGTTATAMLVRNWIVAPLKLVLPEKSMRKVFKHTQVGARLLAKILGSSKNERADARTDRFIERVYAAANDRLFAELGLQPGAFGYPTATADADQNGRNAA